MLICGGVDRSIPTSRRSRILFAGSFLGCQQRFFPGSLITRQDGRAGGREGDRPLDAVTLFLRRLLTFHYITPQNSSVSPVKCVLLTEPSARQSVSSVLTSAQTLPVNCKENSHGCCGFMGLYRPILDRCYLRLSLNIRCISEGFLVFREAHVPRGAGLINERHQSS